MNDTDEDFEALFFTECEELISDLQDHLNLLSNGGGDTETLNAAFRSVHSVKGGAAAFGFEHLNSFAHVFESVLDVARSGALDLSKSVCQVLLRSADVMEALVEHARAKKPNAPDAMQKVEDDLRRIGGLQSSGDAEQIENPDEGAEDAARSTAAGFVVSFVPAPTFFRAGHDALKLVAAARRMGLTKVETEGEIVPITEFSLDDCTVSWRLEFDAEKRLDALESFFSIYEAAATWSIAERKGPIGNCRPRDREAAAANQREPLARAQTNPEPIDGKSQVSKSLRVDLSRVDRLVNLVGEVVVTQAAIAQKLTDAGNALSLELGHSVDAMSQQIRELQESVMAIRAQPVKSVFGRMPRIVRDLSEKLGKDVKLELSGEQTEVDTTVIEELAEPLMHMLRNSMDHGLETADARVAAGKPAYGTIKLSAEHRGERVIIKVRDDGAGVDRDMVLCRAIENGLIDENDTLTPEDIDQLIFHPGFSTADAVSDVSGRGVGMDIVQRKIVKLGGRCKLDNRPGLGAEFTISLPLSLAILDGMTVRVGTERYVVPVANVVEALFLDPDQVRELPDRSRVLSRRGDYLPLLSIRDLLKVPNSVQSEEDVAIIVDTETHGHVALLISELIGQKQVVLKSLEANYHRIDGVSGATILGDGKVALVLDVPNILTLGTRQEHFNGEMVH